MKWPQLVLPWPAIGRHGRSFPRVCSPNSTPRLTEVSRQQGPLRWSLAATLLAFVAPLWSQAQTNVLTYHNDLARTGQNLSETVLTLDNVNGDNFGELFTYTLDGWVFTQPLYVAGVQIPGRGIHNVVYIATEHDSVYAFDADSNQGANGAPLWQVSFINPAAGLTTVPISIFGFNNPPELGITGTPVIDPASSTLYVVAKVEDISSSPTRYYERLYALDLGTGALKYGSPVNLQYALPGTGGGSSGGKISLDPLYEFQRAGLLLLDGTLYIAFASQGDEGPYHGWVVGCDAATLEPVRAFIDTPNGIEGGIWMSGGAPAADADGNIYCMTGNGTFDTSPPVQDFSMSFLKLTPNGTNLSVADYFMPSDDVALNAIDGDLGSGAPVVLPDSAGSPAHPHLLFGAGKDNTTYLMDRDNLGHYNPSNDNQILHKDTNYAHGTFATPAFFNNALYLAGANDLLKCYSISNAQISTNPVSEGPDEIGWPGATPSISANGTNNAIVWVIQAGGFAASNGPAYLLAYNATNVAQRLYSSADAGTRDRLGLAQKFSVPTVANGKVYVGTGFGLTAFGNLGAPFATTAPQGGTVYAGTNVTFYVGAGGTPPLAFQWLFNGEIIENATNSWLSLTNVQLPDGGVYTVQLSNPAGTNVTDDAVLYVLPQPPRLSINTRLQMTVQGTVGQTYYVQYCTSLDTGAPDWLTFTSVTLTNPIQSFFDPDATNVSSRFYRVVGF
jgi:hypothetical protein